MNQLLCAISLFIINCLVLQATCLAKKYNSIPNEKIYQIDIIAIQNNKSSNEHPLFYQSLLPVNSREENYYPFDEDIKKPLVLQRDHALNNAKNRITQSKDYTVFFYRTWLQKIKNSITFNKKIIIQKKTDPALYPSLLGNITIHQKHKKIYMHLNFFYNRPIHTNLFANNIPKANKQYLNNKIILSILNKKPQYTFININNESTIIPKKINYIDHPFISFLVKIKEFNFIKNKNY